MTNRIVLGFDDYRAPAQRLAEQAGLDYAEVQIHRFPDGESRVRVPTSLPSELVLCRSLDHPNDKLVELALVAETLRELGAERLSLVAPYLCYRRQDKAFVPGEAVSQRIVGHFLGSLLDELITVDPHLHRVGTLKDAIPVQRARCLSAAEPMARFLAQQMQRPLLVGPDEESSQWVQRVAELGGLEHAVAVKQRLGDRDVRVTLPDADVAGRHLVILDDMASTGRTLAVTARGLMQLGAVSVSAMVTHALFIGDAVGHIRAAGVANLWSTDSIAHHTNCIELAPLLAEGIGSGVAA